LQQIEGSMQRNDKQQGKSASSNSELQTLELPKKEKVETKSKPRAKMYCILCGADNSMLPRPTPITHAPAQQVHWEKRGYLK